MIFDEILNKFRSESFTQKRKDTQFERLIRSWLLSDIQTSQKCGCGSIFHVAMTLLEMTLASILLQRPMTTIVGQSSANVIRRTL